MLANTDGLLLASVAGRVRQGELGLSPLGPRVRPGHLAAPDGLPAVRSGYVRRAAGQHGRARACERGRRAPKQRGRSRPRPQPGRLRHPDPCLGGSPRPSPAPARDGRLAPRPHLGPGPDGRPGRARRLIANRAYDGDAFCAWRAHLGVKAVIPARKAQPTRNSIRRATPWNGASAGSRPSAMPHTRSGAWVFCTWQGPRSG